MKKQMFLLTLLTICTTIQVTASRQRQLAEARGETVPSSVPVSGGGSATRGPVTPPSASTAPSAGPVSAAQLQAMAASEPANVAAGLAAGLNKKYGAGDSTSAAFKAAYGFASA